jgi:transcription elongation factor GreA-like protein
MQIAVMLPDNITEEQKADICSSVSEMADAILAEQVFDAYEETHEVNYTIMH